MVRRVLIPLHDGRVAPRFDLATEVLLSLLGDDGRPAEETTFVFPRASAEELCRLAVAERASVVVCNGIEQEHFEYLAWKRVEVLDRVVGGARAVLLRLSEGGLRAGDILRPEKA